MALEDCLGFQPCYIHFPASRKAAIRKKRGGGGGEVLGSCFIRMFMKRWHISCLLLSFWRNHVASPSARRFRNVVLCPEKNVPSQKLGPYYQGNGIWTWETTSNQPHKANQALAKPFWYGPWDQGAQAPPGGQVPQSKDRVRKTDSRKVEFSNDCGQQK